MKKSYLMFAIAGLVLTSCAQDDLLRNDVNGGNNDKQEKIGFASFAEMATRGDKTVKTNLEFYHTTFSVYSTKKSTVDNTVSSVFDEDVITYASGSALPSEWTYSPYRYWDKQANYEFIAVAPNADYISYSVADGAMIASGDFTGSYTLNGENIQATATTAEKIKGFATDTDIMTSAINEQSGKTHATEVNMVFHHILAKLNVAVKKDAILDNATVKITSLKIGKLVATGTYAESSYTANASGNALTSGWTTSGDASLTLAYTNASGEALNISSGDAKYFVESLVMPQTISSGDATVTLKYQIVNYNASGDAINTENFTYQMDLADAWTTFMDRNNYTLKFTIKPDVIKFDATAVVWAENNKNITIE